MADKDSSSTDNVSFNDDQILDGRIDQAKRMHEAMRQKQSSTDGDVTLQDTSKDKKENTKSEDMNKITVDRDYVHGLREEAKEYRLEKDKVRQEMAEMNKILGDYFNVDSPQALKEKLEEERKLKEREDEGRLNKFELAERKAKELERQREEERIKFEQEKKSLTQQRDKIIIQSALINEAIANDVANPKQLLKLLEHEFFVDPDKLVPLYKAADGFMPLAERVKVFLDEPENWNLVTAKIAAGSGTKGTSGQTSGKKVYSKEELADLRTNRPKEYKSQQAEIMQAYREGRVH